VSVNDLLRVAALAAGSRAQDMLITSPAPYRARYCCSHRCIPPASSSLRAVDIF